MPAKVLPVPVDVISGILAGLLEVMKIVGVGVALDLPGLEDMNPGSAYLRALATPTPAPPPEYYAAAADFEPGPILADLFKGLDDMARVMDSKIFDGIRNDIAVPTQGVWDPAVLGTLATPPISSIPGFPIDDTRRLAIGPSSEYWHCSYFHDPAMRAALLQWLPGQAPLRVS